MKDIHIVSAYPGVAGAKSLVDHFNPRNVDHMKAFDELTKTGFWPKGFIDGYTLHQHWLTEILYKIAKEWTHHCMESGGMKLKLHIAKINLMGLGDHRPQVETAVAVMEETGRLLV